MEVQPVTSTARAYSKHSLTPSQVNFKPPTKGPFTSYIMSDYQQKSGRNYGKAKTTI